jgi:putative membrane protein
MTETPDLKLTDILAMDRTRMAAERNLMAWVRTALSMIAFGFTIYKFMQFMQERNTAAIVHPNAPRNFGLLLIAIGTFAVIAACIQHRKYVRTVQTAQAHKPWDIAFIVAFLVALLGLLMFGSVLFGSGPLG